MHLVYRRGSGIGKVGKGRSIISRLAAIDWSLVAFVFALCGLTFAYGVATMALKIFPYQLFVDAKAAAQSLRLMEDENAGLGMLVNKVDDRVKPVPVVKTFDAAAGNELLLVTGGPAQDAKRLMVSSKDESRDFEIDIASRKPLWSMTQIQDAAPFQPNGDKAKPLAGFFMAFGTYYVSPQQAQRWG